MGSSVGKSLSISYFIAAALLAVFGFAARQEVPSDGAIQIVLGVVMLGAGLFLRGGSSESRIAALGAAALVCAYGVFDLGTGRGYVPGTIVAVFAFVRLMGAQAHFGPASAGPAVGQPTPYGAPYGAPAARPQPAYPQPAYPQPAYPQPPAPPVPAPWSPPTGGPAPVPAPAPMQPPAPAVQPPSDPRFG